MDAEYDWRLFGHSPTADDLLNRHLARTCGNAAVVTDAAAQHQVAVLRDVLAVVRAALDDEQVPADVARRVIERVIYGAVPQLAQVSLRQAEFTRLRQREENPDR